MLPPECLFQFPSSAPFLPVPKFFPAVSIKGPHAHRLILALVIACNMASDHATTRYPAIWPRPSTLNADGQSWNNRPGPPSVVPQILPLKRLLDEMDSDLAFISSYPTVSDREFKMTDFQIDKKAYDDGAEISRAGPPADASSSNGPKFAVFRNMAMKEYLASQRHTPAKDHSAWLVAAIRTCQHTGKAVLALHVSSPTKNPLSTNSELSPQKPQGPPRTRDCSLCVCPVRSATRFSIVFSWSTKLSQSDSGSGSPATFSVSCLLITACWSRLAIMVACSSRIQILLGPCAMFRMQGKVSSTIPRVFCSFASRHMRKVARSSTARTNSALSSPQTHGHPRYSKICQTPARFLVFQRAAPRLSGGL